MQRFTPGRRAGATALLLTAITLSCSDSNNPTPTSNPAVDVSVVQGAMNLTTTAYQPNPATVSLSGSEGGRVRWTNNDGVTHTVTEDGGVPLFDDDNLGPGNTFEFVFTQTGSVTYHCDIHPNMVGTITVVP